MGPDQRITKLGSTKRLIRFGEGTIEAGSIANDAWNRGLMAIGAMARDARSQRPDRLKAVATSAIREAANGRGFTAAVKWLHEIDVEIISAQDEARLAYEGAVSELREPIGRVAVIDVGGGSIEVALGEGSRCTHTSSVTLGVLRLRDAFEIEGPMSDIEAQALAEMLRMSLEPVARQVREHEPDRVILASGTARAVYQLAAAALAAPPTPGQLSHRQALELRNFAVGTAPSVFEELGIAPQRADTIAIGAVVFETLLDRLRAPRAEITSRGLREGVALRESLSARSESKPDAAHGLDEPLVPELPA